jgi:hypothetical protein
MPAFVIFGVRRKMLADLDKRFIPARLPGHDPLATGSPGVKLAEGNHSANIARFSVENVESISSYRAGRFQRCEGILIGVVHPSPRPKLLDGI